MLFPFGFIHVFFAVWDVDEIAAGLVEERVDSRPALAGLGLGAAGAVGNGCAGDAAEQIAQQAPSAPGRRSLREGPAPFINGAKRGSAAGANPGTGAFLPPICQLLPILLPGFLLQRELFRGGAGPARLRPLGFTKSVLLEDVRPRARCPFPEFLPANRLFALVARLPHTTLAFGGGVCHSARRLSPSQSRRASPLKRQSVMTSKERRR